MSSATSDHQHDPVPVHPYPRETRDLVGAVNVLEKKVERLRAHLAFHCGEEEGIACGFQADEEMGNGK